MPANTDDAFYERADAHILLANDQLQGLPSRGMASASMLFGTARFNAWVSACGFESSTDMATAKEETLNYFCEQYRKMLEENLDDYIKNFSRYMQMSTDVPDGG